MDILTPEELDAAVAKSKLTGKYNTPVDPESAYEILTAKLAEAAAKNGGSTTGSGQTPSKKPERSMLEKILDSPAARQAERTAAGIITRSLLGALGLGGKSKKSWF
jgi:hypothetical protein